MGSPQRKRTIDPHTYGGSPAGVNLAKILNEQYPHLHRKVGAFYSKFAAVMISFNYSWQHFNTNRTCRGGLLEVIKLYKEERFRAVKNSSLPEIVKSHLLNTMTVIYYQKRYIINRLFELNTTHD